MAFIKQFGVIPYTVTNDRKKPEKIVLITSRASGCWIFPKGNPIKKKNGYQAAELEAFEEAGIEGKIIRSKLITTSYTHNKTKYSLTLYPMEVQKIYKKWPEKKERKRKLVSLNKAHSLLEYKSLQKCLQSWSKKI